MSGSSSLRTAHAALREASHILVFTGAGVSRASGIPTFRDALTGLWSKFDPAELASEAGFRRDPEQVWRWYAERRNKARAAEPNGAHIALAAFSKNAQRQVTVVTQNVDGLHQRAGQARVVEYHGNLLSNRCLECQLELTDTEIDLCQSPPTCPACGGWVRPGVVWFGEQIDPQVVDATAQALAHADLVLSLGTSAQVYPAADILNEAIRNDIPVLEINPAETPFSERCRWSFREPTETCLPRLLSTVTN